jgi:hypothetical protein
MLSDSICKGFWKDYFTKNDINTKKLKLDVNNSQRTAIIILSIFLFTVIILTQDNDKAPIQEEISASEENIVDIAVTYMKLADDVQRWPHPVSEEKIVLLINSTGAEINQYCNDNQIDTRFKFIPTPVFHKGGIPAGENPPGLDEMIQLNNAGINLIVGHDYSSANWYSLDYTNEQNMLLLSPMGVGLGQSIPDDNLFKLTPNVYEDPDVYDRVYAQMIKELGYDAFISINTGKHCIFRNLLDETSQAISYSYEGSQVEFDVNADDLTPYLDRAAENLQTAIDVYGVDHVCVLIDQLWDYLKRDWRQGWLNMVLFKLFYLPQCRIKLKSFSVSMRKKLELIRLLRECMVRLLGMMRCGLWLKR